MGAAWMAGAWTAGDFQGLRARSLVSDGWAVGGLGN